MMATARKENGSRENTGNNQNNYTNEHNTILECNICFDNAMDAVVSVCGHLFCWPCLYQWLVTQSSRRVCPVCNSVITKDRVIPIYGPENTKQERSRNNVPPRPSGRRTEPNAPTNLDFNYEQGGYNLMFGIGAFPFGILTSFNVSDRPRGVQGPILRDDIYLTKLFLSVAIIFIVWLLLA